MRPDTVPVRSDRFPMLDGPSIDWIAAEEAYADYRYLFGCEQSLERIAQRGGFGWAEVALNRKDAKKKQSRMVYLA